MSMYENPLAIHIVLREESEYISFYKLFINSLRIIYAIYAYKINRKERN